MTAIDRAKELRAQADALESLAGLEDDAAAAKNTYSADQSPENREAHRLASAALNAGRAQTRTETAVIGDVTSTEDQVA